jgi:hypothetical protein
MSKKAGIFLSWRTDQRAGDQDYRHRRIGLIVAYSQTLADAKSSGPRVGVGRARSGNNSLRAECGVIR